MTKKIEGARKYLVVSKVAEDTYRLWGTNVMYHDSAVAKVQRLQEEFPEIKDQLCTVEMVEITEKPIICARCIGGGVLESYDADRDKWTQEECYSCKGKGHITKERSDELWKESGLY